MKKDLHFIISSLSVAGKPSLTKRFYTWNGFVYAWKQISREGNIPERIYPWKKITLTRKYLRNFKELFLEGKVPGKNKPGRKISLKGLFLEGNPAVNKCSREETLMGKIFLKETHHHTCNVYLLPLPGSKLTTTTTSYHYCHLKVQLPIQRI